MSGAPFLRGRGAAASLVGEGVIRGVLGAVDCQTRAFAEAGYSSLTSSSSTFQVALTALLTIYVALVGFRMLFASGGAKLSDAPGIALKIGAILALVTSWATFQTLVFDVASKAPGEIAAAVAAPLQANSSSLAADPVNGLQAAYDQLNRSAVAFGATAGPNAKAYSSPQASAAEALSAASGALFMTTAGVIAGATLAIGVLTAVGPVFIAMFLIPATRGLLRGLGPGARGPRRPSCLAAGMAGHRAAVVGAGALARRPGQRAAVGPAPDPDRHQRLGPGLRRGSASGR